MKLINHIKRWNKWRKGNLNHPLYKFLVLTGWFKSPTMCLITLEDEGTSLDKFIKEGWKFHEHTYYQTPYK